jgi:RNA polymerase sigma-70 factor (ECF subfamily)
MKAWAKQDSFEMGTNMKAWLFTILRNEFYSQMRKRGREVQDSDGAFTERMAVHPSQYGIMDLGDFRRALDQLPDDQREAIILIGASGFSYEEAAEICKCAIGTMKSRVSRARTKLQELLQVTGEGDYGPDAVSAQVTTIPRFT